MGSVSATHPALGAAGVAQIIEAYRLLADAAAAEARARYRERRFRLGDQLFAMSLGWQVQARRLAREAGRG
jgi:hypothetical protein